jgi:hypothetical protein
MQEARLDRFGQRLDCSVAARVGELPMDQSRSVGVGDDRVLQQQEPGCGVVVNRSLAKEIVRCPVPSLY